MEETWEERFLMSDHNALSLLYSGEKKLPQGYTSIESILILFFRYINKATRYNSCLLIRRKRIYLLDKSVRVDWKFSII